MTAAFLARAASRAERDSARKTLFANLADEGETQAGIIAPGLSASAFKPDLRAKILARLVRILGPRRLRAALAASKVRGLSVYSGPATHAMPSAVEAIGARHNASRSGSVRAAIFGVNDGLVSNTSLVMGMTGAAASPEIVLLTGTAGLLAGAFSMAAGEYVSMRTQREMFEHQIAQEREELALYPNEEAEELALIYAARGFPLDAAREMAKTLVADPERALDALAREELGLNPDDLGSASGAALSSFAAFAAGAFLPLTPFLVGANGAALTSAILAALALFFVGAAMSLFTGRNALLSGMRMLAIGAAAALATWGAGRLFGVAIG
jgi:VIT1/CCC1 family predicted Fe2+/Mn2+ transporter